MSTNRNFRLCETTRKGLAERILRTFLDQLQGYVNENQCKPELIWTLNWKLLRWRTQSRVTLTSVGGSIVPFILNCSGRFMTLAVPGLATSEQTEKSQTGLALCLKSDMKFYCLPLNVIRHIFHSVLYSFLGCRQRESVYSRDHNVFFGREKLKARQS